MILGRLREITGFLNATDSERYPHHGQVKVSLGKETKKGE